MKKVVIAAVALVIVFFGIKLLFNNGETVDPRVEVAAYLTNQLDGLNADLSKLKMKVEETDEEGVAVVMVSGIIKCDGALVVKSDDALLSVAPVVTEAVVEAPEGEVEVAEEPAPAATSDLEAGEKADEPADHEQEATPPAH
jgi:hypothetical protein